MSVTPFDERLESWLLGLEPVCQIVSFRKWNYRMHILPNPTSGAPPLQNGIPLADHGSTTVFDLLDHIIETNEAFACSRLFGELLFPPFPERDPPKRIGNRQCPGSKQKRYKNWTPERPEFARGTRLRLSAGSLTRSPRDVSSARPGSAQKSRKPEESPLRST